MANICLFCARTSFPKHVNYEGMFKPENLNADLLFALCNINYVYVTVLI